jgi:hypothetical protein
MAQIDTTVVKAAILAAVASIPPALRPYLDDPRLANMIVDKLAVSIAGLDVRSALTVALDIQALDAAVTDSYDKYANANNINISYSVSPDVSERVAKAISTHLVMLLGRVGQPDGVRVEQRAGSVTGSMVGYRADREPAGSVQIMQEFGDVTGSVVGYQGDIV